jgi:hypothetical protein
MYNLPMEEVVFQKPSMSNVAWENMSDEDWRFFDDYRGDDDSLYELSLDKQFMFLCFVVQSENRPVLF